MSTVTGGGFPRWRRLARLAASTGLAVMVATVPATATLATGDDDAEPLAELTSGLTSLESTIETFGPTVLRDGRRLSIGVEVVNTSVVEAAAAEGLWMELRMTRTPLATREQIAAFQDAPINVATRQVARAPVGKHGGQQVGSMAAGQSDRVALGADAAELDLPADDWGVYGVALYLHDGSGAVAVDAMVVTWLDTTLPTMPVSVIATASGAPARVNAIVAAADHPAVTVLVDPTAVEDYSATQRALVGREVYRLPAHHPDVTSLARADDPRLLAYASEMSLEQTPAGLDALPWLGVVAALDEPTVAMLHEFGAVAAMVEPSLEGTAPDQSPPPRLAPPVSEVDVPGADQALPVVVPDSGLSELLAGFRPTHPATPARVVAEAAMLAAEGAGVHGVVASTGRAWVVDGQGTSPTLSALFSAPWVESTALTTLLSAAPRAAFEVSGADQGAGDIRAADLEQLNQRLERIRRLAHTTPDPEALIAPASQDILSAVSLHGRSDPDARDGDIRAALERTDETLESVAITTGSALNLVAASGNVPITVRNDLPVDTTVTVAMMTSSPYIDVADEPTITVPAESQATALVPVTAVSSANVNVSVVLRDSDGEAVTQPQTLEIRVRADWGNAATGVFTVALVLLLIAGLVRTIRRGRKDTRTGRGPQAERAEPAPVNDHD